MNRALRLLSERNKAKASSSSLYICVFQSMNECERANSHSPIHPNNASQPRIYIVYRIYSSSRVGSIRRRERQFCSAAANTQLPTDRPTKQPAAPPPHHQISLARQYAAPSTRRRIFLVEYDVRLRPPLYEA